MSPSRLNSGAAAPDIDEVVELGFEVEPRLTLAELRHGGGDPTIRFEGAAVWRAAHTDLGPACLRLAPARGGWRVSAWGPGAAAARAAVPRLLGAADDPSALALPAGWLHDLARRFRGLRFGRTDRVWPALLPAVCGQKVTYEQAQRAFVGIVRRFGQPAPGPGGLMLVPPAEVIASLAYHQLHPFGLEQRRAVTLIRAAELAPRLEAAVTMPPGAALARLRSVPGVGQWTAAEVARAALGDPDAVSLGDFHLPNIVCWALAGEARGDDTRMLELLEPFRGQRARVVRLIELSGWRPPRYGPRLAPAPIERL